MFPQPFHWKLFQRRVKITADHGAEKTYDDDTMLLGIDEAALPEAKWTNAQCVLWISKYLQERCNMSRFHANRRAKKFHGTGEKLFTTYKQECEKFFGMHAGRYIFLKISSIPRPDDPLSDNHVVPETKSRHAQMCEINEQIAELQEQVGELMSELQEIDDAVSMSRNVWKGISNRIDGKYLIGGRNGREMLTDQYISLRGVQLEQKLILQSKRREISKLHIRRLRIRYAGNTYRR